MRRISRRDMVPPSRITGRILTLTEAGDVVFGLLDLRRASSDLEAVSLFPDGVYEEERELIGWVYR